jgi:hypothetical protein
MTDIDLEKQINQKVENIVNSYLTSENLQLRIQKRIDDNVDKFTDLISYQIYTDLVNDGNIKANIERTVLDQINQTINSQSLLAIRQELAKTPVKDIVSNIVKNEVGIKLDKFDFPVNSIDPTAIRWSTNVLSGSYISGGQQTNFSSSGIDDKASQCELTIMDGHVVVENDFTVKNINCVEQLNVKNLSLTGSFEIGTEIVDHGPFSQLIQHHASMIVDHSLEPYKALINNNKLIIENDTIDSKVMYSNLRKIGNLQDLTVIGDSKFGETMFIGQDKVGINTENPRGALTVWDQDAELTVMRSSRNSMFIGSTRFGNIELGTNNQPQIVIKEDSIDINNSIKFMGIKFSVSDSVPEYLGELNELVFVNSVRSDQPKLYMCLGSNSWKAII